MKKFLLGVMAGVGGLFLLGYLFVRLGGMPVATKGNPLPLEEFIARTALHAAMDSQVDKPSPLPASDDNFLAGAHIYQAHCAVCHGQLDQPASAIAKGLFPPPPQLLPPEEGVTDDEVGEIYWKARHGIRLTGMPGFEDNLTDNELWQVSLLLLHANKLPEPVVQALRAPKKG